MTKKTYYKTAGLPVVLLFKRIGNDYENVTMISRL